MAKKNLDQLSKQILLKGFIPVISIILGIVALQYYFYATNELKNNQQNLSVIAKSLSTKIEGGNQFAVGLAQTMALAQTNGLFGNRLDSSQYAKEVLANNPTLTGAYFGYEQNADLSDQTFLTTDIAVQLSEGISPNGRFLPYWFRDSNNFNAVTLTPLVDMETSLYYQGVKDLYITTGEPQHLVTEPYEYDGKLIVEYVFPIVLKGDFKGIAGVDKASNDLVSLLKTESQTYGVDIFLISNEGRFISSTIAQNTDLATLLIKQTPYYELFDTPILSRGEFWFEKASDPFEKSDYFYTSSNVSTGNWLVIVRKAEEKVTGALWQTAALLLGLSVIGLMIAAWLINRVLRRTNRRIGYALDAANQLAKGEIPDADRLISSKNDEVSVLLHAFKDVVEHYKNIRLACKKMAEGDFNSRVAEKGPEDILSQSLNTLADKLNSSEQSMLEAMRQASNANESKGQFLANMSHEIRTPMNAVIGLSRLCLNTALNAQQKDYLEKIHSSGRSLLDLINDILDFSKIESGKLELENTEFSLEQVFDDLASVTMQSAHQKGLELLFNVPYGSNFLKGDPLRLGQILTNLTSNAIKFSQQGEVVVQVKLTPSINNHTLVTFEVSDQGIGISDEQQKKLFSAFTQAESSTTRNYGGTGLGLVICKNLVELMGGQIDVQSQLGVGTKVSFSIELEETEQSPTAAGRMIPEVLKNVRILVVDDSATARYILQQQLQRLSLQCDLVASGDEAIELLEKQPKDTPYNLILMDWKMPGMDGIQTARLIKNNQAIPHSTTILMVTAYYGEEGAKQFKQEGLNSFLKKPISDSELYKMLLKCVSNDVTSDAQIDEKWQLAKNVNLTGAHVLIAEDNKINQEIAAEFLQQAGITYDIANNGKEAISCVQRTRYDALLIDLQMPVMGGIEATTVLRSMPEGETLPIIAMTANAMPQHKKACMDAGMNSHISKPVDVDELYTVLEKYIQLDKAQSDEMQSDEIQSDEIQSIEIQSKGDTSQSDKRTMPDSNTIEDALELSAVDYGLALSRSSGDASKALKLFSIFQDSHKASLGIFEQAITHNNHEQTSQIAHSIAGVAEYVGSRVLAQQARDYEYYRGEVGSDTHLALQETLFTTLKQVLTEIDRIINKQKQTLVNDIEDAPAELQKPNLVADHLHSAHHTTPPTHDLHILLVDDDPVSINILSDLLESDFILSTAGDGRDALQQVEARLPDIVLLDINMPVMDGYQTCSALKSNSKTRDIPIIFITGEGEMDEAKCLGLGAVDFISKPYVDEVVKARINTHLSLKQKTDLLLSQTLTDELTQLANQRAYKERLNEELARSKRDKVPLSVVWVELDHFNPYIKQYGHAGADQCLQKVASFLSMKLKRPADFIARIENHRFVVILPNTPLDGASGMANQLQSSIEVLCIEHQSSPHKYVTVSAGWGTVSIKQNDDNQSLTQEDISEQLEIRLNAAKSAETKRIKGEYFVSN